MVGVILRESVIANGEQDKDSDDQYSCKYASPEAQRFHRCGDFLEPSPIHDQMGKDGYGGDIGDPQMDVSPFVAAHTYHCHSLPTPASMEPVRQN